MAARGKKAMFKVDSVGVAPPRACDRTPNTILSNAIR